MAKKKNIGDFNQRVTFRNPTKTADDQGGYGEEYSDLLTTYAAIVARSGYRSDNSLMGGQDTIADRKDIYVYHRAALNAVGKDTIIIYNGKEYKIDASQFIDEVKHIIKYETTGV